MSSLLILDKVRTLLKRWAKENNLILEELGDSSAILREGDNTIFIKFLIYEDIPDIDDLNRQITLLASKRSEYNKMYILTGRDTVSILDGKLLKKVGIGVLVVDFDNEEIREVLQSPAVSVKKTYDIDISKIENYIKNIVEKYVKNEIEKVYDLVRSIEERVLNIEKMLSNMKSYKQDIEDIWNVIDRLKLEIERLKNMCTDTSARPVKEEAVEVSRREEKIEMPEYLKDNPWIQIIANKSVR